MVCVIERGTGRCDPCNIIESFQIDKSSPQKMAETLILKHNKKRHKKRIFRDLFIKSIASGWSAPAPPPIKWNRFSYLLKWYRSSRFFCCFMFIYISRVTDTFRLLKCPFGSVKMHVKAITRHCSWYFCAGGGT